MWAGVESAASHRAAARLYGLNGLNEAPIEISIIHWKKAEATFRDGTPLLVHRVDAHLVPEIVTIDGIPVTSVRRTIVDLAGIRYSRTERMLDFVLSRELTDLGQLWLLLEREWMRGRRGVRILRNLLVPRTTGQAPTDSDLELMMRSIIDRFALPEPAHQHPIVLPRYTAHVDFAYPESNLAIEVDSYAWHMNRKAFEEDRERDNELRAQGWNVLRFTWAMLKYEPERVAELIRQALALTLATNS